MRWNVFENGTLINCIVADNEFAALYAATHGYTIEEDPIDEPKQKDPLEALAAENTKLKAQLKLQSEHQTFLEDCILEMADVVYA